MEAENSGIAESLILNQWVVGAIDDDVARTWLEEHSQVGVRQDSP